MSEDSSQPVQPAAETETDEQPSPPPRFEPDETLFEWSAKAPAHTAEPEAERKADEQT